MSTRPGPAVVEFYSSVEEPAFLRRMLREWTAQGIRTDSRWAVSTRAYRTNRGRLARLLLRLRMYPGYAWVCWRGGCAEPGANLVRVVTTNPFFAPALVTWAARQRTPTVNLLYDLFPEALIQSGWTSADSAIARSCAAITRQALRECTATIFLGERLRAYAEATHGRARRAAVIHVGADGSPFRSSPPRLQNPGDRPRILYSGLMGAMHDTATVGPVLRDPEAGGADWRFHASGSGYAALRAASSASPRASWGEPLADAAWQEAMKDAHVALVTIAAGAERVVMPSKTYSALAAGQAVLAICRRASDLADLVIGHDCGWVVEPGDVAGLRGALGQIAADPAQLLAKRKNAYAAGHGPYEMGTIAREWLGLLRDLAAVATEPVPTI